MTATTATAVARMICGRALGQKTLFSARVEDGCRMEAARRHRQGCVCAAHIRRAGTQEVGSLPCKPCGGMAAVPHASSSVGREHRSARQAAWERP